MPDTEYVFAAPPQSSVAVHGDTRRFPVRRIYCVGRNYAAHVREMGADERQSPFFFQKPADAIVEDGASVAYPSTTRNFQYEIELVLAIGEPGADITVKDASRHVFGLATGIDLTRRDVQIEARKAGRPWEIGKSFDASAAIGAIVPLEGGALPTSGSLSLHVNDEPRQQANLADMIWNSAEIVSQLSRHYALRPGDLIYTGTPVGVGPIEPGDTIVGEVEGVGTLTIVVTDRA